MKGLFSTFAAVAALACAGLLPAQTSHIAYDVPAGTSGNQAFGGALGMDFDVNFDILVTRLGAFDSLSDGISAPLTTRLYNRDSIEEVAIHHFDSAEPGDLVGGSRFKDVAGGPLLLPAGFHGTIVAEGYNAAELLGNRGIGPLTLNTNDGGCAVSFVGSGRWDNPGGFPVNLDGGPANRFAAGTFEFQVVSPSPGGHAGIAYVVPAGTAGNQAFSGTLGMDFDVASDIVITRLGAFDDNSDGMNRTISVRLYNRDTLAVNASAQFTGADPGELVGGSRFKTLAVPLGLPAGFHGVIVSENYGSEERNGNQNIALLGLSTDDGAGLLQFVGTGRFGVIPGGFPGTPDAGAPQTYATGTFAFEPASAPVAVPQPPTGLSATAGDGEVTLRWASAAGCPAPAGYNIYQTQPASPDKLNPAPVTGNETVIPDLINGVEYCFVLRSVLASGLESGDSEAACASPEALGPPPVTHIAYEVPEGTTGSQAFGGALGADFEVKTKIIVTRLGVFDDGSNGLSRTITARLYDRKTRLQLATLQFTPDDPGVLVGGNRFKDLPALLTLNAGFLGTIVGEGYGADEKNGNLNIAAAPGYDGDGADCSIAFSGVRNGAAGAFPAGLDYFHFPSTYLAGTFEYGPVAAAPAPTGGIAYQIPAGTAGNQNFGGTLGLDFTVNTNILVRRLGVFDDLSDGIKLPIKARLHDLDTGAVLASLTFTPDSSGELVGGNRFKSLPVPIVLPAGFHGTMVAEGYGNAERNGNQNGGLTAGFNTFDGNCVIQFFGGGRFGTTPNAMPNTPDAGPVNRYGAGTFEFELTDLEIIQLAGDVDQDGKRDISDIIGYLKLQFPGFFILDSSLPEMPCPGDAASAANLFVLDINGDSAINLGDAVYLAMYLFTGGAPPVQGPACLGLPPGSGCSINANCQ